jgi:acetylornithine deacetylase/succinyl-diaminopimelate desuccinylase-like protein
LELAIEPGRAAIEEAFELTAALVRVRSYPGEEAEVQQVVADWFTANGLGPALSQAASNRPNVTVTIENGAGPTFLLNGHVDTVLADANWSHDPWQGRREGDRFYGLGAADMKSGVAAAMLATRALANAPETWKGTLVFTSVVDEEAYSVGANALIDAGISADYCVVTESGWDLPALGSFGKYLVRAEVTGKGAHASMPGRGINAAIEAARFVAKLEEMALPAHPRIRPSQTVLSFLSGSPQYVITVPDNATVLINRHTIPGETEGTVLNEYRSLADSLDSAATFAFAIDPPRYPAWEEHPDQPFVIQFGSIYNEIVGKPPEYGYWGFGDTNLFSTVAEIPTIMFGPRGGNFHEVNEWVDLASIPATTEILVRLVQSMLPRLD